MTDDPVEELLAQMRDASLAEKAENAALRAKVADLIAMAPESKALLAAHRVGQQAIEAQLGKLIERTAVSAKADDLAAADGRAKANAELQGHLRDASSVLVAALQTQGAQLFNSHVMTSFFGALTTLSMLTAWHYSAQVSNFRAETADKWAAGARFMQEANPEAWNMMVRKWKISEEDLAALEACKVASNATTKSMLCKHMVEPNKK